MPVQCFTPAPHARFARCPQDRVSGQLLTGVAPARAPATALAISLAAAIAALLLSACHRGGSSSHPVDSGRKPTLTLQQLMSARIDPAADALWDAVAYVATESGVEDRQPRTDGEWGALRTSALTLLDATRELASRRDLVVSPDRTPGPGELSSAEIERRIAANPAAFAAFARALERAAQGALGALDAHDAQALLDAGGTIDEACEACHVTYWYPDQQRSRP